MYRRVECLVLLLDEGVEVEVDGVVVAEVEEVAGRERYGLGEALVLAGGELSSAISAYESQ